MPHLVAVWLRLKLLLRSTSAGGRRHGAVAAAARTGALSASEKKSRMAEGSAVSECSYLGWWVWVRWGWGRDGVKTTARRRDGDDGDDATATTPVAVDDDDDAGGRRRRRDEGQI